MTTTTITTATAATTTAITITVTTSCAALTWEFPSEFMKISYFVLRHRNRCTYAECITLKVFHKAC